jgi:hypothetical protein
LDFVCQKIMGGSPSSETQWGKGGRRIVTPLQFTIKGREQDCPLYALLQLVFEVIFDQVEQVIAIF